jgi:phosphoglycerate dehydrogenase-like enzyme
VRAGVPRQAVPIMAERAPDAEVVALEDLDDLGDLDFIVPIPRLQRELVDRLPQLERLAVIQTLSAGVDALEGHMPDHVTLCSARGARDGAVAEWVLGALLGASSRIIEKRGVRHWDRDVELIDISDSTVLIVGMGSIGERVAELLAAFGTRTVGVVSRARDGRHGIDELDGLLGDADAVVLLTPLTDATRHLMDARTLALMKDGALLVNAARGAVVDTDALAAQTSTGRLRAVLDVTDPEPLPDGHPLWDAAGILSITPHIGGDSPRAHRQAAELAGDQLARFCAGEPLRNVVHQGEHP